MPKHPEFRNRTENDARPIGLLRHSTSDPGSRPQHPERQPPLHRGPALRDTIAEASRSLALLDAERLEELAIACQNLNCEVQFMPPAERAELGRQARESSTEMAVFVRMLEATRANLNVMRRLHDLRQGRSEYGCQQLSLPEKIYGDD